MMRNGAMKTDITGIIEGQFFRNKKIFYVVFSALVLLISLTGLNGSLQNVDETLFARVSRESLEENSWMIQIKDGEKLFFKSPMVFWTAMVSFKLFGVSDFTAKLPSAVANIISSFVILFICIKIFKSYKAGIIAVFIYLCSIQGYGSSHQIATDSLVQMFMLSSLFFCLKGADENKRWFLLAGFLNGMAFLSKSAFGFAIPATLLLYIIIQRRFDLITYFVILVFTGLVFSVPYYVYVYRKIPEIFVENFLYKYLLFNIIYGEGSLKPFQVLLKILFYLGVLCAFILPFTPGLFFIFYRGGEEKPLKKILWNELSRMLSIYFLVVIIGYSLIREQMSHYTFYMIPVAAVYLGESLRDLKNKKVYLGFALFAAMAITLFSVWYFTGGIHELPTYWDVAIGLLIIYVLFVMVNLVFYIKNVDSRIGVFFVTAIFFVLFTAVTIVTVPLDFNHDIKKFSKVYKEPAPLVVVGTKQVNEGSKTRVTIWYMRKRSGRFKTLDDFLKASDTIERGTYLIYYKEYTDELEGLYDSFTELQKGKIWNIGIVR
jgi:4-amino-4-deoxy-L-arabinose transferase-like glycosyltransferase